MWLYLCVVVLALIKHIKCDCPNFCSGNGYCNPSNLDLCICVQGFTGVDCSQRVCPAGHAWVDYPTGPGAAHAMHTECSNMGICDRSSGTCTCRTGFTGEACQRMSCRSSTNEAGNTEVCGGRGRCMSMREAAWQANYVDDSYFAGGVTYNEWDADQIYGCVCDAGFTGYACQNRVCPYGLDPLRNVTGENEVQLIDCYCPSCTGSNSFLLTFRGHQTLSIPYYATAEYVQVLLQSIATIDEVAVSITGTGICGTSSPGSTTSVTFLRQYGNLPVLVSDTSGLASTGLVFSIRSKGQYSSIPANSLIQSQTGTKVVYECSNHGRCNTGKGECTCEYSFYPSDGKGGIGTIPDCGFLNQIEYHARNKTGGGCLRFQGVLNFTSNLAAICSGVGTCHNNTCICPAGYSGSACEIVKCPTGYAWFDHGGHTAGATCSGMGSCDNSQGICSCDSMFSGTACELLTCSSNCSGLGTCMTMSELGAYTMVNGALAAAKYNTTWDSNQILGCQCPRQPSVDFRGNTNFQTGAVLNYRGPYAYATTDFTGYDCSLKRCPVGDNPMTLSQVNEIQSITCIADDGFFNITFRDFTTAQLEYNITSSDLKTALQDLWSINEVNVTYVQGGSSACNRTHTNITVEFLTEHGELPLLMMSKARLYFTGSAASVKIVRLQAGTKENAECSQCGICNEQTGICDCANGFYSSNGSSAYGQRGDCGFRNPWATQEWFVGL